MRGYAWAFVRGALAVLAFFGLLALGLPAMPAMGVILLALCALVLFRWTIMPRQ